MIKTHSTTIIRMQPSAWPGLPHYIPFIKGLISLNLFRSPHHQTIYNNVPYHKTHSLTVTRMPSGTCTGLPYILHIMFCESFLLFMLRVCHAFLSVYCSLVVTCWERANLLALLCVMFLSLSHVVSWVKCGT